MKDKSSQHNEWKKQINICFSAIMGSISVVEVEYAQKHIIDIVEDLIQSSMQKGIKKERDRILNIAEEIAYDDDLCELLVIELDQLKSRINETLPKRISTTR